LYIEHESGQKLPITDFGTKMTILATFIKILRRKQFISNILTDRYNTTVLPLQNFCLTCDFFSPWYSWK